MKSSRRRFIQASATSVAAAATTRAADPYAPAEAGLPARLFDKGSQHVLPRWAFDGLNPTPGVPSNPRRLLIVPPTPQPAAMDTWLKLSGGAGRNGTAPYAPADTLPVGKVLHGTAVEWNGNLIGGNMRLRNGVWEPAPSAWNAMRERSLPDGGSFTWSIADTGNWGKFRAAGFTDQNDPNGEQSLVRCYRVVMHEALAKLRPDAAHAALLYTYAGMVPGPTFRFRHGMPAVVRFVNNLQTEVSIHHHGGHNPTHSDGFPTYYVLQGQARDYLYPNILPLRYDEQRKTTEIDFGEGQSTTWYHDHGLDATAFNVSHGLAGFALWFDDLELELIRKGVLPGLRGISGNEITISLREFSVWLGSWRDLLKGGGPLAEEWKNLMLRSGVVTAATLLTYQPTEATWRADAAKIEKAAEDPNLPGFYHRLPGGQLPGVATPYFNPYDLPIVLQDRIIDRTTGQIVYDSDGHNGYIGDTQLINGVPWPVIEVKARKYRLRVLDGSNARIYRLRFLDSATFRLLPNADGDLEPEAIPDQTLENRAMEFLRIGKDSWLWPMPQKRKSFILNMANRADLVVDFKAWHEAARRAGRLTADGKAEYFLVNTMPQFDGRGPKGKLAEDAGDPNVFALPFTLDRANPVVQQMVDAGRIPGALLGNGPQGQPTELNQPIGLIKFVISPDEGEGSDADIGENTILRPRHRIPDEEVMAVREFVFERGKGAWMINSRFYDPTISNANPVIGVKGQNFRVPSGDPDAAQQTRPSLSYAEEWIFRNGGGGWWHPIHVHLEGHQLVGYEKDFEADGVVGPDGVLGIRGQAGMAGLPAWDDLVGRFGLNAVSADETGIVRIRTALTRPVLADFSEDYRTGNTLLPVMLASPDAAPALFGALRAGPSVQGALRAMPVQLAGRVNRVLDALDQLRLQWAGEMVGNHDTQALGPNTVARIRMRFRTWSGPLVFHCHNVEHEDMRMMVNFEATMSGKCSELNLHDPNVAPAARSHGQDVTDLLTNPHAVGEMPWEARDNPGGFPAFAWEEKPVPATPVGQAGEPLIRPRPPVR